jgi:4-methoxybenzoate monooxygenase (O-demethylating)
VTAAAAPVAGIDPFSVAFMRDPYPHHEALRELGPLVRLGRYECWAVARYEQVNAVLMDWAAYSSGAGVGISDFRKEKPWRVPSIILEADPPRTHARTRSSRG